MTDIAPITRDEMLKLERVVNLLTNGTTLRVPIGDVIDLITSTFDMAAKDPSQFFNAMHVQGLLKPYYNKKGNRTGVYISVGTSGTWYTPAVGRTLIEWLSELVRFPKLKILHDLVVEFDQNLNRLSEANAPGDKYLTEVTKGLI